jgi:hypothetical protein
VTQKERRPAGYGPASNTTRQADSPDRNGHEPHSGLLFIPDLDDDVDNLTAALAYAKAGIYLVPVRRGSKNPGDVVGRKWHTKSSRDPKVITAWFAGTDHGIALHCGRSGLLPFDVDNPEKLPEVLRRHLDSTPFQNTRPDQPERGHYVFGMPAGRMLGNGLGRLPKGWGEIRGLNGVIIVAPNDDGRFWKRTGAVPLLPDEIAELLDDASPAEDAATDTAVEAFLGEHIEASRPGILAGMVSALRIHFEDGESRHQSTVSVLTGAMKEARAGYYSAQHAVDSIKSMFLAEVAKPPISDKQGAARIGAVAESEFNGILAWGIGQANGADPDEIRARSDEKMPDKVKFVDNLAGEGSEDDDQTVPTVAWPTLGDAAMHGTAGEIVNLVAPHTEADPAAILVQLLAVFGATLGSGPHFIAGNDRHQAIIHSLIVGRTNSGAKGTSLSVVEAIRRRALDWFDEFTVSGLSSAEGLIEMVRDPSGMPDDKDFDPGAPDKRLLVKESEYKSVLVRMRREGNTLAQTLRDAFDCRTLRTLTRKHNRLTATAPHIVVVGHVTPREFRKTLEDSDLSGGSVNRLLICLSRRSRLHSRLGNLPENVLERAAELFKNAYDVAHRRGRLTFTDEFWSSWETVYRALNSDRPDCRATDATARAVTIVLRLSLLYALIDGKDAIDADHLDAALALWDYAEHSARWLFSTHELEVQRETAGGLAHFILRGGVDGRTRTEISRGYFKGNKSKSEINGELGPLVHDGVVIEIKDETGPRTTTRYIHRTLRINEFTKCAAQSADPVTNSTNSVRAQSDHDAAIPGHNSSEVVDNSCGETPSELHSSSNSLVRGAEGETNVAPPGGLKPDSPGQTERVQQALARVRANGSSHPLCPVCGLPMAAGQTDTHLGCRGTAQQTQPDGER